MTTEELAMQAVRDAVANLRREWAKEVISGPLDEQGDTARRLAATKAAVADDIVIQLQQAIMKA